MVTLDGNSLTLTQVIAVANGEEVAIAEAAWRCVDLARQSIVTLATREVIYGVNTGVGCLSTTPIGAHDFTSHQTNIIRSGCCGAGPCLSRRESRAMMCLRANVLTKGCSGVRRDVIQMLVDCLNRGVHPLIPEIGSVGASGDLIPLSHMAQTLLGEGQCEFHGETLKAGVALSRAHLAPISLQAKEGLSLINGTEAMGAVGGLAVYEAERLVRQADIITACTVIGLGESRAPFEDAIHRLRPHPGQMASARRIAAMLVQSETTDPTATRRRPQSPYSLRCAAQVHGASAEAIVHGRRSVEIEMNSVTDNPVVVPGEASVRYGGNFHGQPLAIGFDTAAIGVVVLGGISERRLELLLNPSFSGLPPFLTPQPGLNSGLMGLQPLVASLVNQNKALAAPSSIDSIPGNGGVEDFVSMGMTSARSLRDAVPNLRAILAVELLAAMQALDLRGIADMSPPLQAIYGMVRERVPQLYADRALDADIANLANALASTELENAVGVTFSA